MPVFPTLIRKPDVNIQMEYDDPTISSKMENGLVITRPRYTAMRRSWTVAYSYAPAADLTTLDNFVRGTVLGGSGSFTWTCPGTGEVVDVRFVKLPQVLDAGFASPPGAAAGLTYNLQFTIQEVNAELVVGEINEMDSVLAVSVSTVLGPIPVLVLATAGASGITLTLPTAVGYTVGGKRFRIVMVDTGVGGVTINTTSSQTINGVASIKLTNQYQYVTVESDRANWIIVGNN